MDNFNLRTFLAEGKLHEAMFDVATTEKIAQQVADAFTAEDNELDLKYVVTPGTGENSFDLDVEAGPNTPGEDWKDKNGFSIDNYLGQYAGGSFYIKDGVVYNAASRNAPVANVSPEGEVEMISAEESRAAIGMEENKEETKSNKMKKSELKEMIRNAFLNETEIEEIDMLEAEEEDKEEVEVDAEEIDVDTDAETADAGEVDVEADAEVEMTGDKKEVQDNLQAALEAAKGLGDQKLVDQIGNSITFFTRTHVVGKAEVAEADIDVEVNSPVEDAKVGMDLEEAWAEKEEMFQIHTTDSPDGKGKWSPWAGQIFPNAKSADEWMKKMEDGGYKFGLKKVPMDVKEAEGDKYFQIHVANQKGEYKPLQGHVFPNPESADEFIKKIKAKGSFKDGIKKLPATPEDLKVAETQLNESINRMKKLAGLIK